jgi:hypothetical protein
MPLGLQVLLELHGDMNFLGFQHHAELPLFRQQKKSLKLCAKIARNLGYRTDRRRLDF